MAVIGVTGHSNLTDRSTELVHHEIADLLRPRAAGVGAGQSWADTRSAGDHVSAAQGPLLRGVAGEGFEPSVCVRA